MKSVTEEIKKYRYQALEASSVGNRALAKQWRMAIDQAYNFYLQQQWVEKPSSSLSPAQPTIPLRTLSFNYQIQAVRQEVSSILQATRASENQHHQLAQQLVTTASEIREAAAAYHYWIAEAKKGSYQSFLSKSHFACQQAELCRLKAHEAKEAHDFEVSHQWSIAACLFQEASRKLKMAQATYHNNLSHLTTDYWRAAAHAAYHAGHLQAQSAELFTLVKSDSGHKPHPSLIEHLLNFPTAIVEKSKVLELASQWKKIALLADNAMVLKAKAARFHQKNEFYSIEWSLGGYWMSLAAHIKAFLLKTSPQLLPWEEALREVEKTAHLYQQALPFWKKEVVSSPYWTDLIASSEDRADRLLVLAEKEFE